VEELIAQNIYSIKRLIKCDIMKMKKTYLLVPLILIAFYMICWGAFIMYWTGDSGLFIGGIILALILTILLFFFIIPRFRRKKGKREYFS